MRIINIVDSIDRINYGIWHAAVVNASHLAAHGIQTELWYPGTLSDKLPDVIKVELSSLTINYLEDLATARNLDPKKDFIITHGTWQYPTRWGAWLKKKGFNWMYVPQGMLEPWALQQKWLKKQFYFHLFEKRMVNRADVIRAVSLPENENLKPLFPSSSIRFIPNGVEINPVQPDFEARHAPRRYLFLSRLHAKKNVLELVNAWLQSKLNNNSNYELLIAGPDQGELEKLQLLIKQSSNIKYIGSVYNAEKQKLLQQCTFYVLPSFSEGLPSALLEAMGYGLVPIITEYCNLPEVFTKNLGVKITTDRSSLIDMLEQTAGWDFQKIKDTGLKARRFVQEHYSLQAITTLQLEIFQNC
jgi:glycosyltransferase involved in cell wall biosynthesis